MATTTKGRSDTRSRSCYGGNSNYGWASGNWSGSGSGSGSCSTTGRKSCKKSSCGTGNTAYRTCCNSFEQKMNSYRTLCNQAKGPWNRNCPSPTTLNSFANWINKGAIIQCCTPAQVSRWARTTDKNFNARNSSPTACKTVLTAKFGKSTIKAVAKTRSGSFMVACSPTWKNGRSFCFPC
ncbi:MAG: hypothetical protein AABZ12_14895 [Planctomycetota bacterium]